MFEAINFVLKIVFNSFKSLLNLFLNPRLHILPLLIFLIVFTISTKEHNIKIAVLTSIISIVYLSNIKIVESTSKKTFKIIKKEDIKDDLYLKKYELKMIKKELNCINKEIGNIKNKKYERSRRKERKKIKKINQNIGSDQIIYKGEKII